MWAFAIVIAVNQIGVAATLVNTLLMATFGALALAFGLSFGLGGREMAAQLLAEWKGAAQAAEPKLKKAASAAQREANAP